MLNRSDTTLVAAGDFAEASRSKQHYHARSRCLNCAIALLAMQVVLGGLSTARADVLTSTRFDAADAWKSPASYAYGVQKPTVSVSRETATSSAQGRTSPALKLEASFNSSAGSGVWGAGMSSGRIPVKNTVTDLGKLNLAFDLWLSENKPVSVRIRSYPSATAAASGELDTVIASPAAGAYYRHTLDLSSLRSRVGSFDPRAPFIEIVLDINSYDGLSRWQRGGTKIVRLDNVSYTSPSFYVKPANAGGNDRANGRSETTAFATVQRAVDSATTPGDVVMVLPGTYQRLNAYQVNFGPRGSLKPTQGTPDRWIVVRSHPQRAKPVLFSNGWNNMEIVGGSAYIEIRGLILKGNRANVKLSDAYNSEGAGGDFASGGSGSPLYNGNGLSIDGRKNTAAGAPHHIRGIENVVFDMTGGGMTAIEADYVTFANNRSFNNQWYGRYGSSGISLLSSRDVDGVPVYKNYVIANEVFRNQAYVPWKRENKAPEDSYSDGNGIIIDTNVDYDYVGRTLVQNNLAYLNGGSGIHSFKSSHVHIINNTAYHNGQTPQTKYGQIFIQSNGSIVLEDMIVANNVSYAPQGQATNSVGLGKLSAVREKVSLLNNLYFDGDTTLNYNRGTGDVLADPRFMTKPVGPTNRYAPPANANPPAYDFHVPAGSPVRASGVADDAAGFYPIVDFDGKPRPAGVMRDRGAIQN